mgnify:CR=1 FL=1
MEESGKKLPTIAFLVVDGTISGGKSLSNPLQGESIVGSETLIQQLLEVQPMPETEDMLERAGHMEMITRQAEEIILHEVVYQLR